MRKYILYNPHWKDYRRVEKTLDEKPATWERYEHEEGGTESGNALFFYGDMQWI